MRDRMLDPSGNLYDAFMKIINSITIKYSYYAQKYETTETRIAADRYIDATQKMDTFYSYDDYTITELHNVGITDENILKEVSEGNREAIPKRYRDDLLVLRRQRAITMFEEKNNYYRMLNGYPDLEDKDVYYVSTTLSAEFNISQNIPVHQIQDYYNRLENGKGDYLISIIEGSGYIDKLYEDHPDKKYLNYIGSNRIDTYTARSAKNFQIIQIRKPAVRQAILDTFIRVYEQCREYFVKTIYISSYSNFIDYYDNFIAMSIMIMTLQQVAAKQIMLGIKREFFDIFSVRALYEAYDVPFNLNIDEDTQTDIVQNLNVLIQSKATDKVIYNIANLLGFTNINIYKYFLTKEHRMDIYNTPIFKYTERFNSNTGEMEVVPDYGAMYDLYFQKIRLDDKDFVNSFSDRSNRVDYNTVIYKDPFWWEDENVYKRIWETEYNFVESKYLGLGVSYSMTEIMFENAIFLKLILNKDVGFQNLSINLPKILEENDVPLFDVIILLICLLSLKHKLWGEIISVPTQVISVVDYINNTERGGAHHDSFTFDFNYLFNPNENEDKEKIKEMQEDLTEYMQSNDKSSTSPDTLSFNLGYFSTSNTERENNIKEMKKILGDDDYEKFISYLDKISPITSGSNAERINALNDMFNSIKGIFNLLSFYLTKVTDYDSYESIKRIYYSLFISKEMSDIFTITTDVMNPETGEHQTYTRTAWTYSEYLSHKNPKLYNAIFNINLDEEYKEFLKQGKIPSETSFYEFQTKVAKGEIYLDYGKLINEAADQSVKDEIVYTSINHIISRLEMILDDMKFMYTMSDSSTPLETLLMQLIRFFKSYTVDILDLDIVYVCDFKPENMIKMTDKLVYMEKGMDLGEDIRMSYSDVINKMTCNLNHNDSIMIHDKMKYDSNISVDDAHGLTDKVHKIWYTD